MTTPLQLRPAASLLGMGLIAAIHLVAAIAFLRLPTSGWMVPALAAIGVSLAVALRREREKCKLDLRLGEAGEIVLSRDGEEARHAVCRGGVDFGWAIWFRWHMPGERRSGGAEAIMLVHDGFDGTHWRQFRVWLRHRSAPPEDLSPGVSSRVA